MSTHKHHRRGSINLWSNHTSTVISITLVLSVLGLLLFLGYHSYTATHNMQERITYKVDLTPDISDSLALALQQEIEKYDYVKQVDYVSKEEAATLFTEELGDDFVGFIGYNPLYPSLMVNFKSTIMPDRKQSIQKAFTTTVGQKVGVTGVVYQEQVVNELTEVFYRAFWMLVVLGIMLLFVSIVLINNTIRISIYGQQQTIQTMRLVGAKNSFIARPFLWHSVLYGFLGALFACIVLSVMVYAYNQTFRTRLLETQHLLPYAAMAIALLVIGIVFCWLATMLSVKRYLKKTY